MIPQTNGGPGRSHERVVPITSAKNKKASHAPAKSHARSQATAQDPVADVGLGKRILEAFKEDSDPTKSLAEIRSLLIGPVSRLHEARMEELISILEEADRNSQAAIAELNVRCDSLATTCEHLISALSDTNDLLQRQGEQYTVDLHKHAKANSEAMTDMANTFDGRLHKMTNEQNHRIDGLATKTANDYQALVTNFSMRIDDLAQATSANDERIANNFESMMVQADAGWEHVRSKQMEAFADGFNDFADRVLALRGSKSR